MGVPLVLPHTSLTIPARSLHNLTEDGEKDCHLGHDTKYSRSISVPKADTVALFAPVFPRNSQLSRVKPTCLTTV